MVKEENREVVLRMLEAMDRHNFEIFDEVLSADVVVHFPGADLDRAATEQMARSFYVAFPDLSHTVEDLMAVADKPFHPLCRPQKGPRGRCGKKRG